MRDLLSELYSKVLNFFQQSEKEVASKDIASNRLKLVLMQDRTNLDSSTIEKMRIELVEVISKYVEIDTEAFNVNLEGAGDSIALMLNIPVIRAKTPEEIEEANRKAEEAAAEKEASEETSEESEESAEAEDNSETAEEDKTEEAAEPEEKNEETENTEKPEEKTEAQEKQDSVKNSESSKKEEK